MENSSTSKLSNEDYEILIKDSFKDSLVKDKTIVEGTGGKTGIALTMIGAAMGYSTIIVIPNDQSKEKIDTLFFQVYLQHYFQKSKNSINFLIYVKSLHETNLRK